MKYLMAFLFALIPALICGGGAYLCGAGPLAWLTGLAVFGFGMDVCLNGSDQP